MAGRITYTRMVISDPSNTFRMVIFLAYIPNIIGLAGIGYLNIMMMIEFNSELILGEKSLFLGRHHLTLDTENRLTIPACFYGSLTDGGIITQGFDRNLWVLPVTTFKLLCQRISAMNLTDPLARLLLRMLLGHAFELEINESGIVCVPQNLLEYAELGKEIVLIGQGDYFEVWDLALWQEQESQLGDANANSERFSKFVIALSAL